MVGVSGGVHVQPANFVSNEAIKTDEYGKLKANLVGAKPGEMALGRLVVGLIRSPDLRINL